MLHDSSSNLTIKARSCWLHSPGREAEGQRAGSPLSSIGHGVLGWPRSWAVGAPGALSMASQEQWHLAGLKGTCGCDADEILHETLKETFDPRREVSKG